MGPPIGRIKYGKKYLSTVDSFFTWCLRNGRICWENKWPELKEVFGSTRNTGNFTCEGLIIWVGIMEKKTLNTSSSGSTIFVFFFFQAAICKCVSFEILKYQATSALSGMYRALTKMKTIKLIKRRKNSHVAGSGSTNRGRPSARPGRKGVRPDDFHHDDTLSHSLTSFNKVRPQIFVRQRVYHLQWPGPSSRTTLP